jgi:Holliday junction resolvase-like predicted endonuclease
MPHRGPRPHTRKNKWTDHVCKTCSRKFTMTKPVDPDNPPLFCGVVCRNRSTKGPVSPSRLYSDCTLLPTGTIGAISELIVCTRLMIDGWAVFRSQSPSCASDIVALKGDEIRVIEVRSGRISKSGKRHWSKVIHPGVAKVTEFAVYFPQTQELEFHKVSKS